MELLRPQAHHSLAKSPRLHDLRATDIPLLLIMLVFPILFGMYLFASSLMLAPLRLSQLILTV